MATITSTIRLVDQMTPTLNKISNAIDKVSRRANSIATSVEKVNARATASSRKYATEEKRMCAEIDREARLNAANYTAWWIEELDKRDKIAKAHAVEAKRLERERVAAQRQAEREALAAKRQADREARESERARIAEEKRLARESIMAKRQAEREKLAAARERESEEKRLARERADFERTLAQLNAKYGNAMVKYTDLVNYRQNQFNSTLSKTRSIANGVLSTFRRILATLGIVMGVRAMIDTADTMMNSSARINNLTGNLTDTQHYLDAIYSSAQRSRGSFIDMVNSVGKLGTVARDAFGSVDEMIAFTELMNKLFVLSGSSAAESSNAMYQLTQAMAAGKLQGDEMRSILENAPLLAQKIADKLEITTGELKDLGAKGLITADVIKEALFESADEIEEKFENMPKTIGQIWTEIGNYALNAFRPVINQIQQFINSPTFEKIKTRIFAIIDAISKKIIRLFELFETPRIQIAISKVCAAFRTLWEIVSWVGSMMVNIAIWICDNWNWIAPIVYTVAWAFVVYKAAIVAVTVAMWAYNAAQFVGGLIAGTVVLTTFGWVMLIIVGIIAVLYLAVAAWNHFTGQTVSATGIIFGAVAFVITCIIDLFIFLWDIFMSVCYIAEAVGKVIGRVLSNLGQFIKALIGNIIIFVIAVFMSLITVKDNIVENVKASLKWLKSAFAIWALNMLIGMKQLTDNLPAYWGQFKANVVAKLWGLVVGGGEAFNSLLVGASDIARKMVKPFENFANAVIDILNGIIRGWNSMASSLSITLPGFKFMGKQVWEEKTVHLVGSGFDELKHMSWGNWKNPTGINLGGAKANLSNALDQAEASKVKPINWGTFDIPDYDVDWGNIGSDLKHLWTNIEWMDFGIELDDIWSDLKSNLAETWDWSQYKNPFEAYKEWYDKGTALEGGITGMVDGIGALLDGLFGEPDRKELIKDRLNDHKFGKTPFHKGNGDKEIPDSMEKLLDGWNPSGAGSGIKDTLGAIKDNTGSTADSTGNIEEGLDLAEEELELLRKLAEQEVINRFTTAEIHVDMTNNNNINSKMDLDGIVTHLSNKLYEELGVVASGVHY